MKRILHLIPQLEEGGAQRVLSNVLAYSHNFEMEVASLIASPPENMLSFFRTTKIPIHPLSYTIDFYAPKILPELAHLVRGGKYDLVHCWLFQSIIQGGIVCRSAGIPCIGGVHSMRDLMVITKQKRWERYVIDHSFDFMDLQVFTSCSMALDFLDSGCVKRDSVRMVYNGVDCDYFTPPQSGGSELVSVGRISPEKGLGELRKVVARLRDTFPGMRCRIAGSGEPQTFEEFEYDGHVDDIRKFLRRAAVYISTSHTEGLSMALLEAQACGVPAVARNIGANSEVIEQGVTGFLCDTLEEFAEAVKLLWTRSDLRNEMAKNARKRIQEKFSIQQQIEKLESIYNELL